MAGQDDGGLVVEPGSGEGDVAHLETVLEAVQDESRLLVHDLIRCDRGNIQ